MRSTSGSQQSTIVLAGIGHTHAHIVREWAKNPLTAAQLVCVSPYAVATYSGMLPGTLARQYRPEQMQIDLATLCRVAGAELHVSGAVAVDLANRRVELGNGTLVPYDVLSLGIGSVPATYGIELAADATIPVKPMQTLLERLDEQLREAVQNSRTQSRALRIAIVGGGAAGVEIAFCLQRRLRLDFPADAAELTIIDSHATVLAAERQSTQRIATGLLKKRGIGLCLNSRVAAVRRDTLQLESGNELPADLVVWATGAAPPPLLTGIDLPKDSAGFLLTRHTLQSTADDRVFVVGDTGTIENESSAKAGVYAVREGPILWHNLHAMLHNRPLREYHPQRAFLRLLNTADGRAILDYQGLVVHARWCWWLKDWIDRGFIGKYQQLHT